MSEKILDLDDLLARVQDDKELLIELFEIFEEFYPERREVLNTAMGKNDFKEVKDIIHSIKGAAGNISAVTMHRICTELEERAENKDLATVKEELPALDKQFNSLKLAMQKVRNDLQAAS